jgi:hypothetical protein
MTNGFKTISGIGPMRGMRGMSAQQPMTSIGAMPTIEESIKKDEELIMSWSDRVGEVRARECLALWVSQGRRGGAQGSTTLPELLAELALKKLNADYRAQVDVGMARPDFIVIYPHGVLVIRVQGDYWHSREGAAAKDARQKDMLERMTIYGKPVLAVADVWESDIYRSEAAVADALAQWS